MVFLGAIAGISLIMCLFLVHDGMDKNEEIKSLKGERLGLMEKASGLRCEIRNLEGRLEFKKQAYLEDRKLRLERLQDKVFYDKHSDSIVLFSELKYIGDL